MVKSVSGVQTFYVSQVSTLIILCPFSYKERKFPKFVSKEMENMYIEELKSSVNLLMANLESMPVSKGGEFKLQKLKRSHNASIIDMGEESENQLSKSDVLLSFSLEVSPKSLKVYWYGKIAKETHVLSPANLAFTLRSWNSF